MVEITILDKARYEIWRQSDIIRFIKAKAVVTKPIDVEFWVGKNGKRLEQFEPGAMLVTQTVPKVVECINPKHALWPEYQHRKREATLWLVARALIAEYGTKIDFQKIKPAEIKASLAADHAPRRRCRRLVRTALKWLRHEQSSLSFGVEVADFVMAQQRERAEREARKGAPVPV